jgi:hypothetical protein
MRKTSLKPGDVVYLKSEESLRMTLTLVEGDTALCIFFDKNQMLQSIQIPLISLRKP